MWTKSNERMRRSRMTRRPGKVGSRFGRMRPHRACTWTGTLDAAAPNFEVPTGMAKLAPADLGHRNPAQPDQMPPVARIVQIWALRGRVQPNVQATERRNTPLMRSFHQDRPVLLAARARRGRTPHTHSAHMCMRVCTMTRRSAAALARARTRAHGKDGTRYVRAARPLKMHQDRAPAADTPSLTPEFLCFR